MSECCKVGPSDRTGKTRESKGSGALSAASNLWLSVLLVLCIVVKGAVLMGQEPERSADAVWWPSIWGPGDEAGASNWITAEKILQAAKLIKQGKIHEIGRMYEAGMPMSGQRAFSLRIPAAPTGGPSGNNKLVYHDDFLVAEIGQVGTQFDGLGHVGVAVCGANNLAQMRFYNGFTEAEIASAYGLKKLGIEKVKPIFTRGILIDVAAYKGRMLNKGEEITVPDVKGALSREGIAEDSVKPGDAILFHTGWGNLWMVENSRYMDGAPGIGLEVAHWLIAKKVCVAGTDTWPVEVVPTPDSNLFFPVHNELITKNGIFLHENLDLSSLANERIFEFVYVMAPLRIRGATGSPGRPIAIH